MQRRYGDLPFALATLWIDAAGIVVANLQESMAPAGPAEVFRPGDPAQMVDQARASLEEWMKQWSALWQPAASQPAAAT